MGESLASLLPASLLLFFLLLLGPQEEIEDPGYEARRRGLHADLEVKVEKEVEPTCPMGSYECSLGISLPTFSASIICWVAMSVMISSMGFRGSP